MEHAAEPALIQRSRAALPLLVPGLAGLGYLALSGAPPHFVTINALALAPACLWAVCGQIPERLRNVRIGLVLLLVMLALPLLTGPNIDGIARWLPLGGFVLHAGMLVIPLLSVLAARDEALGVYALLSATLVTFALPDPGSALALFGAALGLCLAWRDVHLAALSGLALCVVIGASLVPNLAPQPFVEGILTDLATTSPAMAILLSLSLVTGLGFTLRAPGAAQPARYALAGALTGFIVAALLGDYPTPLIGYGAASIIGFGLALPAIRQKEAAP